MGLFKKKEDNYRIHVYLEQRISFEHDLLPILFDQCKAHGLPLLSEPSFGGYGDQTWINCKLADVSGNVVFFHQENDLMMMFKREVSSSTSEDDLAAAMVGFLTALVKNDIPFSFSAYKDGARGKEEKWDRIYPERRSYM